MMVEVLLEHCELASCNSSRSSNVVVAAVAVMTVVKLWIYHPPTRLYDDSSSPHTPPSHLINQSSPPPVPVPPHATPVHHHTCPINVGRHLLLYIHRTPSLRYHLRRPRVTCNTDPLAYHTSLCAWGVLVTQMCGATVVVLAVAVLTQWWWRSTGGDVGKGGDGPEFWSPRSPLNTYQVIFWDFSTYYFIFLFYFFFKSAFF